MKTKILSVVWSSLVLIGTVTEEKCNRPPDGGVQCAYPATVKDFTGLDGCGFLVVLDDSTRLLATNLAEYAPEPRDGDMVRVSYEPAEAMVSICMTENKIVRLTCYTVMTRSTTCPEMVDPYQVSWARRVMTELDPRQVEKLMLPETTAYRFTGAEETRIYSCFGETLCRHRKGDTSACQEVLDQVRETKIIYIVNE